jgi:hypothetical protein
VIGEESRLRSPSASSDITVGSGERYAEVRVDVLDLDLGKDGRNVGEGDEVEGIGCVGDREVLERFIDELLDRVECQASIGNV